MHATTPIDLREPETAPLQIVSRLEQTLRDALEPRGGLGDISALNLPREVADHSDKFLLRDRQHEPSAVLVVSSRRQPQAALEAGARAHAARAALGERLGRVVLTPLQTGEIDGLSYSIAPYREPLSSARLRRRWQRERIAPKVWRWLFEATLATVRAADAQELQREFHAPLSAMREHPAVSSAVRKRAARALTALEQAEWVPRVVLSHYDLWIGNLLLDPSGSEFGFVVIDWAGSRVRGHAVHDLLRLGWSIGLASGQALAHLRQHCRALDCAPQYAAGHALAALGHLASNLGDWPIQRFAESAQRAVEQLDALEATYVSRRTTPIKPLCRHEWSVAADAKDALSRLDLADYLALMNADLGKPLKTKPGLTVHRLQDPGSGEQFYVKRSTAAPSGSPLRLLARWLLRQRPLHTEAFHVYLAAQTLQRFGFDAMPVIAWGERRWLGIWPDQGFMVARAVAGQDASLLFAASSSPLRRRLMFMNGTLMAHLHLKGFCFTLRLHDEFCDAAQLEGAQWRSARLTLIDLDFKGKTQHAGPIDWRLAQRAAARSAYLALRVGHRFEPGEPAAWLAGYLRTLKSAGATAPRRLGRLLRASVVHELALHHADPALAARFPLAPPPPEFASPVQAAQRGLA